MNNCCKRISNNEIPGSISGLHQLNHKRYNKDLAFTREERQLLGIHGLLPYCVQNQDEQIKGCMQTFLTLTSDVYRFIYLRILSKSNERMFFKMVRENLPILFPYVNYNATINVICLQHPYLQLIGRRGLYITITDKGHIYDVLNNWPELHVKVIFCTNSEKCGGYGDLGAHGMPIAISTVESCTVLAGLKPYEIIPIVLDVGTNSRNLIQSENYLGIKKERCSEEEFEEFMDEFMMSVKECFGRKCIVNFENFTFKQTINFLEKYRQKYCMFNNDMQAWGATVLAGLLSTIRLTNIPLKEHKVLIFGDGKPAIGTAHFIALQMTKEGLEIGEARERIALFDSFGLVSKNRKKGESNEFKKLYAHCLDPVKTLIEAIELIKPSILIGVSGIPGPGAFTKSIIEEMSRLNKIPIVFALSDETSFCEITPSQAVSWSNDNILFVGGVQSPSLEHNGQIFSFSMCHNAYIYPGLTLGIMCSGCLTVTDDLFLAAAEKVSRLVTIKDLQYGLLYPPFEKLPCISLAIAEVVLHIAYRYGFATELPKPKNKIEFIKSKQYSFDYLSALPKVYKPKVKKDKLRLTC